MAGIMPFFYDILIDGKPAYLFQIKDYFDKHGDIPEEWKNILRPYGFWQD